MFLFLSSKLEWSGKAKITFLIISSCSLLFPGFHWNKAPLVKEAYTQRTLTKWEGLVQLTSSLGWLVFVETVNNIFH